MLALLGLMFAAPPPLDVPAAIHALESQQVYRAPGTVTNLDLAAVQRELTPEIRILIAPFTGDYQGDAHYQNVYQPLKNWAEAKGVELITVEGLYTTFGRRTSASCASRASTWSYRPTS
jgi:hypothetical protein